MEHTARDNGYWFLKYMRQNHPDRAVYYPIQFSSPDYKRVAPLGNVIPHGSFKHHIYTWAARVALCGPAVLDKDADLYHGELSPDGGSEHGGPCRLCHLQLRHYGVLLHGIYHLLCQKQHRYRRTICLHRNSSNVIVLPPLRISFLQRGLFLLGHSDAL